MSFGDIIKNAKEELMRNEPEPEDDKYEVRSVYDVMNNL